MRAIRWFLGNLILFFDWLFTPKGIKRSPEIQTEIDQQTVNLALFQYPECPFCVKVRRAIKKNSLKITLRDAKRCQSSREELIDGGGKLKVPCLRIEDEAGKVNWMYESNDIINYLNMRFCTQKQTN